MSASGAPVCRVRSAPSIDIIGALQREGAKIKTYDPVAVTNAKKILKNVTYCKNPYETVKGCDCLLLLTEWDEFKKLNFKRIKSAMKQPIVFDGRNLFHNEGLEDMGFEYYGVGRGTTSPKI